MGPCMAGVSRQPKLALAGRFSKSRKTGLPIRRSILSPLIQIPEATSMALSKVAAGCSSRPTPSVGSAVRESFSALTAPAGVPPSYTILAPRSRVQHPTRSALPVMGAFMAQLVPLTEPYSALIRMVAASHRSTTSWEARSTERIRWASAPGEMVIFMESRRLEERRAPGRCSDFGPMAPNIRLSTISIMPVHIIRLESFRATMAFCTSRPNLGEAPALGQSARSR